MALVLPLTRKPSMWPSSIWVWVDDPALRHALAELAGVGGVEHREVLGAAGPGVAVLGDAVVQRVAVAAGQHPEVRVVGVVLLHVDDDVLDCGAAGRCPRVARVGPVAGLADPGGRRGRPGRGGVDAGQGQSGGGPQAGQEPAAGQVVGHGMHRSGPARPRSGRAGIELRGTGAAPPRWRRGRGRRATWRCRGRRSGRRARPPRRTGRWRPVHPGRSARSPGRSG